MEPFSLTRLNRIQLARAFASVPAVDISVACVVEDQMGEAFCNSAAEPSVFMIVQDGFFVYFAGELASAAGQAILAQVPDGRMLMAGPEGWHELLPAQFGARLLAIERFSFQSDQLNLVHLQLLAASNTNIAQVERIDANLLAQIDVPYLEIGAFESAGDFCDRGIGYCMRADGQVIGVAYSSLVSGNAIEISIVVDDGYRRKGIATALAIQLLIWCLEHGVSPHWDAANEASCGLAEKLGYTNRTAYRAYFVRTPSP